MVTGACWLAAGGQSPQQLGHGTGAAAGHSCLQLQHTSQAPSSSALTMIRAFALYSTACMDAAGAAAVPLSAPADSMPEDAGSQADPSAEPAPVSEPASDAPLPGPFTAQGSWLHLLGLWLLGWLAVWHLGAVWRPALSQACNAHDYAVAACYIEHASSGLAGECCLTLT